MSFGSVIRRDITYVLECCSALQWQQFHLAKRYKAAAMVTFTTLHVDALYRISNEGGYWRYGLPTLVTTSSGGGAVTVCVEARGSRVGVAVPVEP